MSMNYLYEWERYYRRRIRNIDENLLMEKESLEEYIEFLEKKVKELKTEIELYKTKIKENGK
jgi:hypothetical protein